MEEMTNREDDPIGRIVRQELEAAGRISPDEERKKRLAGTLESTESESRRRHSSSSKWAYILAPALACVALVITISMSLVSDGKTLGVNKYLGQQIMTFEKATSAPLSRVPRSDGRLSGQPDDAAGSGYLKLFLTALPAEFKDTGAASPSVLPSRPRMSFEETVRVLYFDRYLERFLLDYARRQKEV
ncbi:MAG TPA: hypothetical protein VMS75_11115 [Terriglobales bacterium]|nr:hypothetical protein [Terriglobales bacterium]